MEDRIKSSKVFQDSIIHYMQHITRKVHDATSFMLYSSKLSRLYTLCSMTTDQLLCMCIIRSAIACDNNFMALSAHVFCESPNLDKCLEPSDFRVWLSMNFTFAQEDLDTLSSSLKHLENGVIINIPGYLCEAFNSVRPSGLPSYLPDEDKELDEDIISQTNFKKVIKLFSNIFKGCLVETIKFSVNISKFSEYFLFRLLRPDLIYFLMYFTALHWCKMLNSLQALAILSVVKTILPKEDVFEPYDIANFILSHFDIKKFYIEKMLEYQEKILSSGVIRIPEFVLEIMSKISQCSPISVIKTKKEKFTTQQASGSDMKSKPSSSKSIKFEEEESPRPSSRIGFSSKYSSSKAKKTDEKSFASMTGNTVTVTVRETTEIKGGLIPVTPTISVTPLISNFNAAIPPLSHRSGQTKCRHTQADETSPSFPKPEPQFEKEKPKTGHNTITKGMQTSTSFAGPPPSINKNSRKQFRGKTDINNTFPCKDEIPLLSTSVSVPPTEEVLHSPQTEMDLALMDSLDETLKDYPSNSPASQQSSSLSHHTSPETISSVEENVGVTYTSLLPQVDGEDNSPESKIHHNGALDSEHPLNT